MAFRLQHVPAMMIPRYAAIVPMLPAIIAGLLLAAPVGTGLAQSKEVTLSGMGVRKCVEWQSWKEAKDNDSRARALEWAQGFLAGHNVYARTGSGAATPVIASITVLVPLLDAFCQKNPDERILSGIVAITRELGGAKLDLTPKSSPPPSPAPVPQKDGKGRQES